MSLNAIKSTGTILSFRIHANPGDPFLPIGEVGDIDGPGEKTTFLDATSQEDTAEAVVPSGITRFDELTFPINYIPTKATHDHIQGLRYHQRQKTLLDMKQTYSDGTSDTMAAYCGSFKPKAPVEGILRADVMFKLTAPIVTA
jgi:hypothetical protein